MARQLDIIATTLGAQQKIGALCDSYILDEMLRRGKQEGVDRSGEVKTIIHQLHSGTSYYLDRAVMPALVEAAVSVPPEAVFTPDMFPTELGFVALARPWPVAAEDGVDEFTAFSWEVITIDGIPEAFSLCAWGDDGAKLRYIIGAERFGVSLGDLKGGSLHGPAIYTLLAFMKKRLLVAARADGISRAQRRGGKWTEAPEVFVIIYRKTESPTRYSAEESESVEWSCRWLSRQHWGIRYRGSGDQREAVVTLIAASIKGPADKPMRISPKTLGAIIR